MFTKSVVLHMYYYRILIPLPPFFHFSFSSFFFVAGGSFVADQEKQLRNQELQHAALHLQTMATTNANAPVLINANTGRGDGNYMSTSSIGRTNSSSSSSSMTSDPNSMYPTVHSYAAKLHSIYSKYNPSKIAEIPAVRVCECVRVCLCVCVYILILSLLLLFAHCRYLLFSKAAKNTC